MFWYIVILCLMAMPMTFVYVGYSKKINMNRLVIPMCAAVLLFFMACRAIEIGADTRQYVYGFRQICNIRLLDLFKVRVYGIGGGYELNFEYGYRLFNKLVSFISTNGQAITVANSVLIIVLLSTLIKKQSIYPFLSIWLYITLGIFQTQMNMSRNAIAILICYLAFRYIREQKLVKYLLCVLLAMTFHTSAILFLPFYWISGKLKLTPRLVRRMLIVAIALGFGFSFIRPYVVSALPFGYGRYFAGNTAKFESLAVGVFHLLLLLFTWTMTDRSERAKAVDDEIIGVWMFMAEVFFFCVGYDVSAATRMAALFGLYLIILIPNLLAKGIKSDQKRFMAIVMIIVLTAVQYILRLRINNIGTTMPYIFFWS